jgi:hypothetical protein
LAIDVDILNTLIKNQKDAIKYQTVFACIVIFCGCILMATSIYFFNNSTVEDSLKVILGVGGGFVSTISAFPINQIISRTEKIKTFKLLSLKMNSMTDIELNRTEELIWKSLEKIV